MQKPGYRALRQGRHSECGQIYLVTTATRSRRKYFHNIEIAERACHLISLPELWYPSQCLCWVLMPDHWHGLVSLGEETLPRLMQRFKGTLSRKLSADLGKHGPLWSKGFHDRALRRDESMLAAARYIIANSVRARLVDSIEDYPYWDISLTHDRRELLDIASHSRD
ncbi:MAG TPA: transposase [Dyella sp.]|uniref:REP-associated tyrosine transposase n=1 Tax=Dyella sp. TaxID=1869338 RepID=UPI002F92DD40